MASLDRPRPLRVAVKPPRPSTRLACRYAPTPAVDCEARPALAASEARRRSRRAKPPRMATYRPFRPSSLSTDPPGRSASSNNPTRRTRLIAKRPSRPRNMHDCVSLHSFRSCSEDLDLIPGDLQDLSSNFGNLGSTSHASRKTWNSLMILRKIAISRRS